MYVRVYGLNTCVILRMLSFKNLLKKKQRKIILTTKISEKKGESIFQNS